MNAPNSASLSIQYIGASWCSPCKTVKPLVSVLTHKFSIPVEFIDYDEMEEYQKDAVKKLPTVRIVRDGKVEVEIVSNHVDILEQWLRAHVRVNGEEDF